jgi:hypothetical protein
LILRLIADHLGVARVDAKEAEERGASHPTREDAVSRDAHEVTGVTRSERLTCAAREELLCLLEHEPEGVRARGLPATGSNRCPLNADLTEVEVRELRAEAHVRSNERVERVGPALDRVGDHKALDGRIQQLLLREDRGELSDVVVLYAVAYPRAAEQEIQGLGEALRLIDVAARTVISTRVLSEGRLAAKLERALRSEQPLASIGLLNRFELRLEVGRPLPKVNAMHLHHPRDRLRPGLSSLLRGVISGIFLGKIKVREGPALGVHPHS